ncbi:hypothetical protein M0R45_016062 [Rubus argutus]|uniref:Uncharacterized protein n=1 Tax=Rubus argutus TaxID=59490 RepID=A0AAW1XRI6_RUBAR
MRAEHGLVRRRRLWAGGRQRRQIPKGRESMELGFGTLSTVRGTHGQQRRQFLEVGCLISRQRWSDRRSSGDLIGFSGLPAGEARGRDKDDAGVAAVASFSEDQCLLEWW